MKSQRLMGDYARIQPEAGRLQPFPASRMAGVENRHIVLFSHGVDGCKQCGEIGVRVNILLPMGRQQDVLPLGQPQTLMDIARFNSLQVGSQNLRHGAAHHKGAFLRHAAFHQVAARVL